MNQPARIATLALLVAGLLPSALAEGGSTVYRCGADGRTYQAHPCADGRALALRDDTPDDDQRADAQASQRRLQDAADRMEDDRVTRERHERPKLANGFRASPLPDWQTPRATAAAPKQAKRHGHRRGKTRAADQDDRTTFTAIDPSTIPPRRPRR